MSAPLLTIDVEADALLAALATLSSTMLERFTKPAAKVTADAVAADARARVARRTGATAEGIHVDEDRTRTGYVVLATREGVPHLPYYLDVGTIHMHRREFFHVSASLEQGAHDRRMRDAIQNAIDGVGLGS